MRNICINWKFWSWAYVVALASFYIAPSSAVADNATTILSTGTCVSGCSETQTAVTISSLGLISNSTTKSITPSFNSTGQLIFNATISGPGITSSNNQVLLRREANGALTQMASSATPIRGLNAHLSFGTMGRNTETTNVFGNDGSVLFSGYITGAGIDTTNNFGAFCLNGTDAVQLFRYGVVPPGESTPLSVGGDLNLSKSFDPYLHKDFPGCAGVFRGRVNGAGPNGYGPYMGLWFGGVGLLGTEIGRTGVQAPLLPQGLLFRPGIAYNPLNITQPSNLARIEYTGNSQGDALFHAFIDGPGIRRDPNVDPLPLNNEVMWFRSAEGIIRLVARSGDEIPGQPGRYYNRLVQRTVNDPSSPPRNPDQYVRFGSEGWAVNGHAQIAFVALTSAESGESTAATVMTDRSGTLQSAFTTGDIVSSARANKRWRIESIAAGNLRFTDSGTIYATGNVKELNAAGLPTGLPAIMLFENTSAGGTIPILWQLEPIPGVDGRVFDTSFADASHDAENFFPTDHGTLIITTRVGYDWGIFSYRNGEVSLLGYNNQPRTDLSSGYFNFYGGLRPNAKGQFIIGYPSVPLVAGDDTGNFRYVVDPNGHLPNSSEPALQNNFSPCAHGLLSDDGDLPLICGSRLVHYKLSPPPHQCPADFNSDGSATVQDLFDFLTPWFAHDLRADFNHDGIVTVQDLFDFLTAWFAGCG